MFNLTNDKRLVIISAEQAGHSAAANANASAELASHLALDLAAGGIESIIQCNGQYKGVPERSFLVICDANQVERLQKLGAAFEQECILVAAANHNGRIAGTLHYLGERDTGLDVIGYLTPCEAGRDYEVSTTLSGTNIAFHFA